MSRAFVKDLDQVAETLPERIISPHLNLVTARGLAMLEAQVRELEGERRAASTAGDSNELARIARDLRYFQARRDSARPVTPAANARQARFGVRVLLRLSGGVEMAFRLVGEDEADPRSGLISYVSPLAIAMMGKEIGDTVPFGEQWAQIIDLQS